MTQLRSCRFRSNIAAIGIPSNRKNKYPNTKKIENQAVLPVPFQYTSDSARIGTDGEMTIARTNLSAARLSVAEAVTRRSSAHGISPSPNDRRKNLIETSSD